MARCTCQPLLEVWAAQQHTGVDFKIKGQWDREVVRYPASGGTMEKMGFVQSYENAGEGGYGRGRLKAQLY